MDQKLTLFQLNQWIKEILDNAIPGMVWVVAEISDLNENRSGHCYLELVEREGSSTIARARAVIWSYTYRMLKPYFETTTGQSFSQGIKILVQVSVEFHPLYGMSLIIKDIEPAYTVGDVALQRKEIIEKLKAENIFYMNKELSLPVVPQTIAVISSKTAAGYQDFIDQLENNSSGFKFYIRLFESYMQGSEAVPSIINSLEKIYKYEKYFDAVAIIRGGGAAADLACFDNYDLAFHITQFPLPVITGIGHEKDDTIIDLVAHTRLKTPTAVAEFFISGAERFFDILTDMKERLVRAADDAKESGQLELKNYAKELEYLTNDFIVNKIKSLMRTGNNMQYGVSKFSYKLEKRLNRIRHDMKSLVSFRTHNAEKFITRKSASLKSLVNEIRSKEYHCLDQLAGQIKNNSAKYITKQNERINLNERAISLLDPQNIMKRGYSVTYSKGKLVKSVHQVNIEDELETFFSDGKANSLIIKKEYNGNTENHL
jgi:exodeoxyribonuclease VII large subunit